MTGFPDWLEPMAATLTQERFTGPEWIFERKFDGIRLLAFKNGADVRLFSRNRLPLNSSHPSVVEAIANLPVHDVDPRRRGRLAVGRPRPGGLLRVRHPVARRPRRDRPAARRASRVAEQLPLRLPLAQVTALDDPKPWERACAEGWEGVIAKRRDSKYEHRRSQHWLKMKCEATQDFVVGGFTDPQGKRVGLGALLVGYFEGEDFCFAGKVGTGFDTKLLLDLRARLDALEIPKRRSPGPRGCRACARTGCARRSSCRRASSNGPCTASFAIRGCSASAPTRWPARSCERRLRPGKRRDDHASREGAVSADGGSAAITKGELAAYYETIAPIMVPHIRARPVTMERYPGRHRQEGLHPEGRLEGLSRVARAGRGAEEGRHGAPPDRHRHAVAALDRQSEHHHAARLDLARAEALLSGHLRLRPRPVSRRSRHAARRRRSGCATCSTSSACPAG